MDLIDCVNRDFAPAINRSCASKGTGKRLTKGRLPRHVIVLADDIPALQGSKCDCLIFIKEKACQRVLIIVAELKSKNWDPSEVESQINNCYGFIKDILKKYNVPVKHAIFSLALYAERFKKIPVQQLASASIDRHEIKTLKYDVSLERLISRMQ